MSAPHIILDCLPSLCQNYYQIWWKFDVVITKIICLFFTETRCENNQSAGLIVVYTKCNVVRSY